MGILNYLFDNEWWQRSDIEETKRRLDEQRVQGEQSRERLRQDVDERIAALEDDLGHLALFSRTLFRLLVEKGTVGKEEFLEAARAVDAQDGRVDGKYSGQLDAP